MIAISENLVLDGLMKSDFLREKVIAALKKGKFSPVGAFGIFEPQNSENLYEIISLNEVKKSVYSKGNYRLIGLTGSKSEAIMLVAKLWIKKQKEGE